MPTLERNIVYVGFGTMSSCGHPLGVLDYISPIGKGIIVFNLKHHS